jgi:epoxyqueuosine reductase
LPTRVAPYDPGDAAPLDTIRQWGQELGFQALGFTGIDLAQHRDYLAKWLEAGYHGEMEWMASHGQKRTHPDALVPGTCTVITARMDYLPEGEDPEAVLASSEKAYISRYALGRDYHKLIRGRLAKLAKRIEAQLGGGQYRAFVDSAPVLERALAENAGLGWIGKNTMLLNDKAGSWFFLGEIYTDIPLPPDPPQDTEHCGSCRACLDVCPTNAFTAPWVLDARKCISYLTIEFDGVIPESLRPAMGNRIYGCDDCQLVCPWNKFAQQTREPDFAPRHGLDCDRPSWSASAGTSRPFSLALKAQRFAASALNGGAEMSPSPWVTPNPVMPSAQHFKRRWRIPQSWCASMFSGRSRNTTD